MKTPPEVSRRPDEGVTAICSAVLTRSIIRKGAVLSQLTSMVTTLRQLTTDEQAALEREHPGDSLSPGRQVSV